MVFQDLTHGHQSESSFKIPPNRIVYPPQQSEFVSSNIFSLKSKSNSCKWGVKSLQNSDDMCVFLVKKKIQVAQIGKKPKEPLVEFIETNIYFSSQDGRRIGIAHQFPFVSSLQRMSVICETSRTAELHVYCKGAPETVTKFCISSSGQLDFSCKVQTNIGQRSIFFVTAWMDKNDGGLFW